MGLPNPLSSPDLTMFRSSFRYDPEKELDDPTQSYFQQK
jgi:hypothetical protein